MSSHDTSAPRWLLTPTWLRSVHNNDQSRPSSQSSWHTVPRKDSGAQPCSDPSTADASPGQTRVSVPAGGEAGPSSSLGAGADARGLGEGRVPLTLGGRAGAGAPLGKGRPGRLLLLTQGTGTAPTGPACFSPGPWGPTPEAPGRGGAWEAVRATGVQPRGHCLPAPGTPCSCLLSCPPVHPLVLPVSTCGGPRHRAPATQPRVSGTSLRRQTQTPSPGRHSPLSWCGGAAAPLTH